MKINFEFGKAKVSYEYDLEGKNNAFKPPDLKPDLDFIYKTYEKIPLSMYKYYKHLFKTFKQYTYVKKPQQENIFDDPDNLFANGHDRYNYVARYGIGNFQLQAVMKLDGRLDFDKLSKAVRLSVDAEPVLGCRFVENETPYWRRLKDLDNIEFCLMEETDNVDEAVQQFIESPLDMDNDPMVKLKLIRSGTDDTLCVKVNHACADATGTKEYIQLIADIYSRIDKGDEEYIPEPGTRSRTDQDRLFAELGILNPEDEWVPGSEITRATWLFPWKQTQSDDTQMVVCKLPAGQLDKMRSYAKALGATINDLILTAYYRAMITMGSPVYTEPMEIPITVDLRRYLPDHKAKEIRNFSGSETTSLLMKPNETFPETLTKVVNITSNLKNGRPGLQSAIGLERVEGMPWSETVAYFKMIAQWPAFCFDKCAPVLSNLGYVSKKLIKFGDTTVIDAYIIPPVVHLPGLLLMSSSYNSNLTLSAGFYQGSIHKEKIENLINKISDELVDNCHVIKESHTVKESRIIKESKFIW